MSDSISFIAWIDPDLTDEQYEQLQFPARDFTDTDQVSADFRVQYPTSPLTGAGFTITPLGIEIPGLKGKRKKHGRIAGYLVEVNVPACTVGHNRLLVNGVYQAARVAYYLLIYWLARNGCATEGLHKINFDNADIVDLTTTALFLHDSEQAARAALYDFRKRSEILRNNKRTDDERGRPVAYSWPPEAVDPESEHNYTSYIQLREVFFSAYVKESNQPNATLLPLADDNLEAYVQDRTARTLRVENRVHGKWLKNKELNKPSAWKSNPEAYEKVFGLLRTTLRLDEKFRTKRLKKTSIAKLCQCEVDELLLAYHLEDGVVRDHKVFRDMPEPQRSKYYSAIRLRIFKKVRIDVDIPYAHWKQLSSHRCDFLTYPGQFDPDWGEPGDYLGGYVFSPVSAPVVIAKLQAIIDGVLEYGPDFLPPVPDRTVYNGPSKPKRTNSVGDALVIPGVEDQFVWIDGERLVA